jgi:hypothetical protein
MLLLALLGIAALQPAVAAMSGTWEADHRGTTFVRLELKAVDNTLAGTIRTGNVNVDKNGDVTEVTALPATPTPLYELVVKGQSLTFMRPEGTDAEHFRFTVLSADQAELLFLPSDDDLEELKEAGIPAPKPFRLHKIR